VRVALLAESFLPHMNGVTGSVLHVLRHLEAEGHETLLIAPRAGDEPDFVAAQTDLRLMRSVPLPSYPDVHVVFARAARLAAMLREFQADVVHLASPFVLGWQGVVAAEALRIPSVAVYQTDVIAYARKYGMPRATALVAGHVARLHRRATITLAPSSASIAQLEGLGVDRLRRWGRGVDAVRFTPERRSESWRDAVAPGERIIGYVGRLAPEKQVEDLRALADLEGTRLVIVGDGPARAALERDLPGAVFTGHLAGDDLARALASFDVFVHPGESETFCQTVQEALASGVPVVATGRGGPLDLVRSSVDGWLYGPGDLADLRGRVADLLGDDSKRRAFGTAARESVRDRTWDALGRQLVDHYAEARMLRRVDDALAVRAGIRPHTHAPTREPVRRTWTRYVALGDSLTEGLCDTSRMAPGEYRGWADRLAGLLATGAPGGPFRYANLAVRSKTVSDVVRTQVPVALALRPDLVSILVGANDLVRATVDPARLISQLGESVAELRANGCDVLLVTPFLPQRAASRLFARRFAVFNSGLRSLAAAHGALLLDLDAVPRIGHPELWAADRVHLRSAGHRYLAYRAADVLGVPDAEALGGLDAALHGADAVFPGSDADPLDDDAPAPGFWLTRDALPWAWRRLRGRTAGDGRAPKHRGYVEIAGPGTSFARTDPS
jgi:phosphatidylinositol alpha 1,6-mannosyltransferase